MLIIPQTNIRKLAVTRKPASSDNNTTQTNLLLIYTSIPNNSNYPIPSITKTTTISKKDTVMGETSKKSDIDIFNS